MVGQKARSCRIEASIHPDTLMLVKRAAEMQGRSASCFVVTAAERAAHERLIVSSE